jgi:hypothetical protein
MGGEGRSLGPQRTDDVGVLSKNRYTCIGTAGTKATLDPIARSSEEKSRLLTATLLSSEEAIP